MNDQPFTRQRLDDEPDEGETFTVRLNKKEREMLEDLKRMMDIKSDGKALKIAGLIIGRNVLHSLFGAKILAYLFKKDRLRLSDFVDLESKP